jgi:hypothetical protein
MFPWRPLAITSLVLGVVGIAVGAPLVIIDGQPTCNAPMPQKSCPEVYNTVGGGGALLAFGIAGALASVPLFVLDHRARHRTVPKVSVLPLVGGAFVSAGTSF